MAPRSQLRRTVWYTALFVASIVPLCFPQAPAARVATDTTPPLVSYTIDGILGNHDWYRGSTGGNFIVARWSVSDPESQIISTSGCEPAIQINGPNTGTTRTCSATSDGGTTTVTTRLLKIDATPPVTTAAASRPPNIVGWYRAPLSVTWSGADATSGVASCRTPLSYNGPDTTGDAESGTCTDNAGNSSSDTLTIRYDTVAPTTAATPNGPPNAAGWYRTPLAIGWNGTDATSGIAGCRPTLNYAGPDTSGTTVGGNCTDNAGNTSSAAITFKYDSTPPVTDAASAPAPNAAGWFRSPLSIGWSGSDVTSGIASCRPALTYSGPDTTGTMVSGSCTDKAGNSSAGGFLVKYDTTPPAFKALALKALDDKVRLRWKVSGAAGLRLSRSPGMKRAASSDVYSGNSSSFADDSVENYVRYRYTLSATDAAGNTAARSVSAVPLPVLYAPRPGAHVGRAGSLLFAWRATKKADYYNLQLWRGGHKVGSWWPSSPRLRLPSRWRSEGKTRRLRRGSYAWYVWPGRGARRLGKYGAIVGKSTFAVR